MHKRPPLSPTQIFTRGLIVSLALILFAGFLTPVFAEYDAAIAQAFTTEAGSAPLTAGALVSSKPGKNQTVELSTVANANRMLGVVSETPFLTISDGTQGVNVVLSGGTKILVSDINGAIKAGDKIAASPLAGIGMKATAAGQIIGSAQIDQPTGNDSTTKTVTSSDGKSHTVRVGLVTVQVGVTGYQPPGSGYVPPVIQSTANTLAGKQVALSDILMSGFLLIATVVGVAVLLQSSAKASLTSIGRNPSAANAIHKSLYQVGALAVIISILGIGASYLVIKF